MALATVRFAPLEPVQWRGRYARIPGKTTAFHLQYVKGKLWPIVLWRIGDDTAKCPAVASTSISNLVKSVARAKVLAGGRSGGGAFLIDEFGNVIVPACDAGGRKYLAGRWKGAIRFENPFDPRQPFDLAGEAFLQPGDPWKLPYVGMLYHLHRSDNIYFHQQDENGRRSIYPRLQDRDLIRSIRRIRPYGPVRLVVTHAGVVLTKAPVDGSSDWDEENWQPVYIGSIDPNLWFDKE